MGKVQEIFGNGRPGAVSRSVDDIIISVRNAGETDIPFGAPVFMTPEGAVPFDIENPQEFFTFVGFAVRVADKTPDTYGAGQFSDPPEGAWHAGDVVEILTRGSMAIPLESIGSLGSPVYIRKADGKLTTSMGTSNSTVLLENVRIRNPRDASGCAEITVNRRNAI